MFNDSSSANAPKRYLERRYQKIADKPFDWFSELVSFFHASKKEGELIKLRLQFMDSPLANNTKYLEFVKLALLLRPNVSAQTLSSQIKKVMPSLSFAIRNNVARIENRNSKIQIHYAEGLYLGIYVQITHESKWCEYHFTWNFKHSRVRGINIWSFSVGLLAQDLVRLPKNFLNESAYGLSYQPSTGLVAISLSELYPQSISAQLYSELDMAFSSRSLTICHCFDGKHQVLECLNTNAHGLVSYITNTRAGYINLFTHLQVREYERITGEKKYKLEAGSFYDGTLVSGFVVTDNEESRNYDLCIRQKYSQHHEETIGHEIHIKLDSAKQKVERVLFNFGVFGENQLIAGHSFCIVEPGRMDVHDGIFDPLGRLASGTKTVFGSDGFMKNEPNDPVNNHSPVALVLEAVRYLSILSRLKIDALLSTFFQRQFDLTRQIVLRREFVSFVSNDPRNEDVLFHEPLNVDAVLNPAFNSLVLNNVERIVRQQALYNEVAILPQKVIDEKYTMQRDYETSLLERLQQWPPYRLLLERHHILRTVLDEQNKHIRLFIQFHEERLIIQKTEEAKQMLRQYTSMLITPSQFFQFILKVLVEKRAFKDIFYADIQSIYLQSKEKVFAIKSSNAVKKRVDGLTQVFLAERATLEQSFGNMLRIFSTTDQIEKQFDSNKQEVYQSYAGPLFRSRDNFTRFRTEEMIPGYTGEQLFNLGMNLRNQASEYAKHLMIPCVSNDNQPILRALMDVSRLGWDVVLCGSAFRGSPLANDLDIKILASSSTLASEYKQIFSIFKYMILNATKMTGLPEVGRLVFEFAGPRRLPINIVICFFDNENRFPSLYTHDIIARIKVDGMLAFYLQGTVKELDTIAVAKTILTQELSPQRCNVSGFLRVVRDLAAMPEKEMYNQQTLSDIAAALLKSEQTTLKREINLFLYGDQSRNAPPKVRPEISAPFRSLLSRYLPGWEKINLPPEVQLPNRLIATRFGVAKQIELLAQATNKAERSKLIDEFQNEEARSALGAAC